MEPVYIIYAVFWTSAFWCVALVAVCITAASIARSDEK